MSEAWRGQTYYGRPQLKAAPFNHWVVGGYVALAGLSGTCSLLAAIADVAKPAGSAAVARNGRWLSLLAPTLGSALLVWDLHTPQRFYNMFRVAKGTSPMSVGTWILSGFGVSAMASAGLQWLADRRGDGRWRGAALAANLPGALLGMGLGTYTAALMAATSTPLWAAAPRALGVRFGSASVASGAAALSILQDEGPAQRALDTICAVALGVELATNAVQAAAYRRTGVAPALEGGWGLTEKMGATGLGVAAPLALYGLAAARGEGAGLSRIAAGLALAGSLLLRVSMLGAGGVSAEDPAISLRFAQPDNLPRRARRRRRSG